MVRSQGIVAALLLPSLCAAQTPLETRAAEALARASGFFRTQVSAQGGYLWVYSEDLTRRRGEGDTTNVPATQGWVQPPGTPSVGMAFLHAYEATGDPAYRAGAAEAARALVRTQLASGGWDYRIEFDPEARRRWHYRSDGEAGDRNRGDRRNTSVFDDNTSQSALRLLMRVDTTLKGTDPDIRRAVEYGLTKLREAQFPNGAWPQRYNGNPPTAADHPVRSARYPETWARTFPGVAYDRYYTLNDNALRDIILTLLEAHRLYGKAEYLEAARRGGDFLLLARMPEPQPAWAQQYTPDMEPAWARRFEPPSVVSRESADAVRTLLDLYLYTGDPKYREPLPAAIAWFQRSRLPDGKWARFYELKTNRPLYFTRTYELVYTDDDLPTHYAFQADFGIANVLAYHEAIEREGREKYLAEARRPRTDAERQRAAEALEPRVRALLDTLDDRGRWLSEGIVEGTTMKTIDAGVFNSGIETLADYLAARRGKDLKGAGGVSNRQTQADRQFPRRLL